MRLFFGLFALLIVSQFVGCSKDYESNDVVDKWFMLGNATLSPDLVVFIDVKIFKMNHVNDEEFYSSSHWFSYGGASGFMVLVKVDDETYELQETKDGRHFRNFGFPLSNNYKVEIYKYDELMKTLEFVPVRWADSIEIKEVRKNAELVDFEYTIHSTFDTLYLSPENDYPGQVNHNGYKAFPDYEPIFEIPVPENGRVSILWSELHPQYYQTVLDYIDTLGTSKEDFLKLQVNKSGIETLISRDAAEKHRSNLDYAQNAVNPFYTPVSFNGNLGEGELIGDFFIVQQLSFWEE